MKEIIIKGRKVIGGVAEGEALVTRQAISGWGGTNPIEGKIIERKHELEDCYFTGKILVFRGAKGSSGWSNAFHIAKLANKLPKGIIFTEMTTKIALGAVVMDIPAMTDLERDPFGVIETGDWIRIDSDNEQIIIRKNK